MRAQRRTDQKKAVAVGLRVHLTVRDLGFKGALVQGATGGRYLDHPSYEPLLARAEALDVPIYVHPAPSPKPARDALYGELLGESGF